MKKWGTFYFSNKASNKAEYHLFWGNGCLASGLSILLGVFLLPFEPPTVGILIQLALMIAVLALPLSGLSGCDQSWPRQWAFAIVGVLELIVVAQLVNAVVACRTPIPKGRISTETLTKITEAKRRMETIAELPEEKRQTAKLELIRELMLTGARLAETIKRSHDILAGRFLTVYTWLTLISVWTFNWLGMQTVNK